MSTLLIDDRSAYRRDAGLLAIALAAILGVCFAPFLFGDASLMESTSEGSSIYATGAVAGQSAHAMRVVDNASAFVTEPWLALEHRIIVQEHRLPLWDSYDGYGTPFAAAMQPQPYYPLTTLLAMHPSPRGFSWWIVARLFVCGWFAALYLRLFADRWSALAAGVACSLTGYFLAYLNMPHVSVEVMLPMLLWATELLCRGVTGPRAAALAAAVGLTYLGGMPEAAFLALGVAAAYAIVRLFTIGRGRFNALGAIVACHILGLALGAIQLLPFVDYVGQSFNIHDPDHAIGMWADLGWVQGVLLEFVPRAFGSAQESILTPARGYTGLRGFFGCSAAVLAIVAFAAALRLRDRRRPIVFFLSAVAIYAILKRFGNPLVDWTGELPILHLVYLAKYLEPILGISVGILAGFGVAAIRERRVGFGTICTAFTLVLLVLSWLYAQSSSVVPAGPLGTVYFVSFALAIVAAGVAGIAACCVAIRGGALRSAATVVLVGGLAVEPLAGYLAPTYWFSSASQSDNPYLGAPYIAFLRSKLDLTRSRVLGSGVLFPNWAGAFGIDDPRSLNALYPAAYLTFVDAFLHSDDQSNRVNGYDRFVSVDPTTLQTELGRRWLQLSSIEYVLSDAGPAIAAQQLHARAGSPFKLVFQAPGVTIFHVADASPRLTLIHHVRAVRDLGAALAILTSATFDVKHEAVVLGDPLVAEAPLQPERVFVTSTRSDLLTADVDASSPALLLENDTWFPGWTASIDGTVVPIMRADGIFRGIPIPAGHHHVEIAYQPLSAYVGAAISIAALMAMVALLFTRRRISVSDAQSPV